MGTPRLAGVHAPPLADPGQRGVTATELVDVIGSQARLVEFGLKSLASEAQRTGDGLTDTGQVACCPPPEATETPAYAY